MKHIKFLFSLLLLFLIFSCKSTEVVETKQEQEIAQNEMISEDNSEVEEEVVISETPVETEDEVQLVDEVVIPEEDEEYVRSTEALPVEETVTKEEFEEDKTEILKIINELTVIMEDQNVSEWLKYISPDSIKYYSTVANIRKAQKKLPDKTIQLHGIGDYFKYVFIPARKRSQVDEIRYISKTSVKAVQVKADNSIIVYYNFVKIDGKWLVEIPPLS